MSGHDCTLAACERTNLPHGRVETGYYGLSTAGIDVAHLGAEGIDMTWTYAPFSTLSDLYKPMMMAMLGGLLVSSFWAEILSARFEFKPALTSYTVFCNHSSKYELKWMTSLCKGAGTHSEAPDNQVASEVR